MTKKYLVLAVLLAISFQAVAQKKEVAGIITSKEKGDPLAGIVVWVKGSNQGLVTASDGYFDLTVTDGDTIEASSPFFKSQEVIVGKGRDYEILLEAKTAERTVFLQLKRTERDVETATLKPAFPSGFKKRNAFERTAKMPE
jgi:hypothetical protein